jgi:hypothetical protein
MVVVVVVVVFSLEPKLWVAAHSPDACRREKREEVEVRDLFVQERKTRGGGGILSSGTDLLGR